MAAPEPAAPALSHLFADGMCRQAPAIPAMSPQSASTPATSHGRTGPFACIVAEKAEAQADFASPHAAKESLGVGLGATGTGNHSSRGSGSGQRRDAEKGSAGRIDG